MILSVSSRVKTSAGHTGVDMGYVNYNMADKYKPAPKAPIAVASPAPAPTQAPAPAQAAPAQPLPEMNFGNTMYNPNIPINAQGYPVNPGYQSVRDASGNLQKSMRVGTPQLSDLSNWQNLKDQELAQQAIQAMDASRLQSFANTPAQQAASLSSGSRGIAALQGLGGVQKGILAPTMQATQGKLGVAEELLGKQFDLEKTKAGFSKAAQAANLGATMKDIQNLNKWKALQYANALQMQQGMDMKAALAAANAPKGDSDIKKIVKNPLSYIPGVTYNPLLESVPGVSNLIDEAKRSDLNPENWFRG